MQNSLIRLFDIVFSLIALILLSPIFLILSLLVMNKMGTPVFFTQKRLGLNGKIFTVYKFRSMTNTKVIDDSNLEKVNEYTIKYKNDPRITPLGAFLRRTSLDELPQLCNVLKGDMSVVGPRPWVPEEYSNLPLDWHARLEAKPGITGLAQINGRSDLPMDKIVEHDINWVKSQNIMHYFNVIIKTVFYTLKMKNVY
jgi:lipopolysaccharide/colanic/teichoic acid biosynthesis glycosyltransferase